MCIVTVFCSCLLNVEIVAFWEGEVIVFCLFYIGYCVHFIVYCVYCYCVLCVSCVSCVLLLCIFIVDCVYCYCVLLSWSGVCIIVIVLKSKHLGELSRSSPSPRTRSQNTKRSKCWGFGCFLMLPAIVSHWMSYCKTCFSPKSNFYLNRTMQRTLHNEHPRIFFSCYLLKCTPKMVHITLTNI